MLFSFVHLLFPFCFSFLFSLVYGVPHLVGLCLFSLHLKKKVMLMRIATSSMKIKGKNKSSRAQYNSMAICLVVLLPWEGLLCVLFGVMRCRLV